MAALVQGVRDPVLCKEHFLAFMFLFFSDFSFFFSWASTGEQRALLHGKGQGKRGGGIATFSPLLLYYVQQEVACVGECAVRVREEK